MVYCTCNVSVLEDLKGLLDNNNIRDYQVIERVTAKNKTGVPRFDTPVWPGYNSSVIMQISEEDKIHKLIEAIREFNRNVLHEDELVTVCTWKLEDYFYE